MVDIPEGLLKSTKGNVPATAQSPYVRPSNIGGALDVLGIRVDPKTGRVSSPTPYVSRRVTLGNLPTLFMGGPKWWDRSYREPQATTTEALPAPEVEEVEAKNSLATVTPETKPIESTVKPVEVKASAATPAPKPEDDRDSWTMNTGEINRRIRLAYDEGGFWSGFKEFVTEGGKGLLVLAQQPSLAVQQAVRGIETMARSEESIREIATKTEGQSDIENWDQFSYEGMKPPAWDPVTAVRNILDKTPEQRSMAWEAGRAGWDLGRAEQAYVRMLDGEDPDIAVQELYHPSIYGMGMEAVFDPLNLVGGAATKARNLLVTRNISALAGLDDAARFTLPLVGAVDNSTWYGRLGRSAAEAVMRVDPSPTGKAIRRMLPTNTTKEEIRAALARPLTLGEKLSPVGRTVESKRNEILEDGIDVIGEVFGYQPGAQHMSNQELGNMLKDLVTMDPDDWARQYNNPISRSTAGKRTAILLEAMQEQASKYNGIDGMIRSMRKAADEKELTGSARFLEFGEEMSKYLSNALEAVIPSQSHWTQVISRPILEWRRPIDEILVQTYLGTNMPFFVRNVANNFVTALVDGVMPFESRESLQAFANAFGWTAWAGQRGVAQVGRKVPDKGIAKLTYYWLKQSEKAEKFFANHIALNSTRKAFWSVWRPRVNDLVEEYLGFLDDATKRALKTDLANAYNEDAFNIAYKGALGITDEPGVIHTASPELMEELGKLSTSLPDEVNRILKASGSPQEFVQNMARRIKPELDRWVKTGKGITAPSGGAIRGSAEEIVDENTVAALDFVSEELGLSMSGRELFEKDPEFSKLWAQSRTKIVQAEARVLEVLNWARLQGDPELIRHAETANFTGYWRRREAYKQYFADRGSKSMLSPSKFWAENVEAPIVGEYNRSFDYIESYIKEHAPDFEYSPASIKGTVPEGTVWSAREIPVTEYPETVAVSRYNFETLWRQYADAVRKSQGKSPIKNKAAGMTEWLRNALKGKLRPEQMEKGKYLRPWDTKSKYALTDEQIKEALVALRHQMGLPGNVTEEAAWASGLPWQTLPELGDVYNLPSPVEYGAGYRKVMGYLNLSEDEILQSIANYAAAPPAMKQDLARVVRGIADAIEQGVALEPTRVPIASVKVDPYRFQFRQVGKRTATGATSERIIGDWEPRLAPGIGLWKDIEPGSKTLGDVFVVNGHHRFAAAQKAALADPNVKELVGVYWIEAKTAKEAMIWGALKNISEDAGSVWDAAVFFRESGFSPEEVARYAAMMKGGLARDGLALAGLSPDIFERAIDGKLPVNYAVAIGTHVPDHATQQAISQIIEAEKGKLNLETLQEIIDEAIGAPKTSYVQMQLLGKTTVTKSLAFEKHKLKGRITESIKKTGRAGKRVSSDPLAYERARQTVDVAGAEEAVEETEGIYLLWHTAKNYAGETQSKVGQLASRLNQILDDAVSAADAAKGKTNAIYTRAQREAYDEVSKAYRAGTRAGDAGVPGAGGLGGEAGDAAAGGQLAFGAGPTAPAESERLRAINKRYEDEIDAIYEEATRRPGATEFFHEGNLDDADVASLKSVFNQVDQAVSKLGDSHPKRFIVKVTGDPLDRMRKALAQAHPDMSEAAIRSHAKSLVFTADPATPGRYTAGTTMFTEKPLELVLGDIYSDGKLYRLQYRTEYVRDLRNSYFELVPETTGSPFKRNLTPEQSARVDRLLAEQADAIDKASRATPPTSQEVTKVPSSAPRSAIEREMRMAASGTRFQTVEQQASAIRQYLGFQGDLTDEQIEIVTDFFNAVADGADPEDAAETLWPRIQSLTPAQEAPEAAAQAAQPSLFEAPATAPAQAAEEVVEEVGEEAAEEVAEEAVEQADAIEWRNPSLPRATYTSGIEELRAQIDEVLTKIQQDVADNWQRPAMAKTYTPEQNMQINKLWDAAHRDLNWARGFSIFAGREARNFSLLDYNNKRHFDSLLNSVLMYPFWSSRTYPNWIVRMAGKPQIAANYMRYVKAMQQANADAPEWIQDHLKLQVPVPGLSDPIYVNVMSFLNPMNSLIESFDDDSIKNSTMGELIQGVDQAGFSMWTPLVWASALMDMAKGDDEAALKKAGTLTSSTRLLRYASGKLGINEGRGITPEFWLWQGGVGVGGDYWELRRATKYLTVMLRDGEITNEQAYEAARAFSTGNLDHPIVKRAMAMEIDEKFLPVMAGYVLAIPAQAKTPDDVWMDQALAEQATIWEQASQVTKEQWSQLWTEYYTKYPEMRVLSLARQDREKADTAWVWHVMSRMPPGQSNNIFLEYGARRDLLDKFFDADRESETPLLAQLSEGERLHLLGVAIQIAEDYDIPTPQMTAEWQVVKRAASEMYDERDRRFPGIQETQEEYFAIKEENEYQASLFLDAHPELLEMWDWKDKYVASDLALMWFYGSSPRDQAISFLRNTYYDASDAAQAQMKAALGKDFSYVLTGKKKDEDRLGDTQLFRWAMYYRSALFHTAQEAPMTQTTMPKTGIQFQDPTEAPMVGAQR